MRVLHLLRDAGEVEPANKSRVREQRFDCLLPFFLLPLPRAQIGGCSIHDGGHPDVLSALPPPIDGPFARTQPQLSSFVRNPGRGRIRVESGLEDGKEGQEGGLGREVRLEPEKLNDALAPEAGYEQTGV